MLSGVLMRISALKEYEDRNSLRRVLPRRWDCISVKVTAGL